MSYWYLNENGHGTYEKNDNKRKEEAQTYVAEIITPIVNKMAVKPKINLQWLFNQKYQKRFSG